MPANNTAQYLADVYSVARSTGGATEKCLELLKGVDWDNDERVKAISLEFRLGRLACYLKLKTRDAALAVNDLSQPAKDGTDDDTRRTEVQQRAYRAAVSGWNHIAFLAGKPAKGGGARTKVRNGVKVTADGTKLAEPRLASGTTAALEAPKAKRPEATLKFASEVAKMVVAYQKANAAMVPASLAAIFEEFALKVRAEIMPSQALAKAA